MVRTIESLGRIINLIEDVVTSSFMIVGLLLIFIGVIARYVFDAPIFWADEVAAYLVIWSAMLGFSVAFKEDRHIRVTILYTALPFNIKRAVHFFVCIMGIIFCVLFILAGIELESMYIMLGQESLNAQIPLWIPYAAIPISGVTFGLRFIFELVLMFKNGGKDWAELEKAREGAIH